MFAAALVMVRSGDKRFFARKSAFDVILGFMLASVLSRAINGSAPFSKRSAQASHLSGCTGCSASSRDGGTASAR